MKPLWTLGMLWSLGVNAAGAPASIGNELPAATAKTVGIDAQALEALVAGARAAHSDALVVVKDGKLVREEHFGTEVRPIEAMSATKSVVSLAFGFLLAEGKLKSLDTPLADFFPEWKQGRKQRITVRHLLTQTSGLQNVPNATVEIYPAKDWTQLALAAELTTEPGAVFSYNNKATNLIAGVVKRISGENVDVYLAKRLFAPLGITRFKWNTDGVGTPQTMAGLEILPADFARIGVMLADGGRWKGQQILPESFVTEATRTRSAQMPGYGLLWWLIGGQKDGAAVIDAAGLEKLAATGVDAAFLEKARTLKDVSITSDRDFVAQVEKVFGPGGIAVWKEKVLDQGIRPSVKIEGPPRAFMANGYLGQYLFVDPASHLVVVRMYAGPADESQEPPEGSGFEKMVPLSTALVKAAAR